MKLTTLQLTCEKFIKNLFCFELHTNRQSFPHLAGSFLLQVGD